MKLPFTAMGKTWKSRWGSNVEFETQVVISDFTNRNSSWMLDIELGIHIRGSGWRIFKSM